MSLLATLTLKAMTLDSRLLQEWSLTLANKIFFLKLSNEVPLASFFAFFKVWICSLKWDACFLLIEISLLMKWVLLCSAFLSFKVTERVPRWCFLEIGRASCRER